MEEDIKILEEFLCTSHLSFGDATRCALALRRIKDRYRELEEREIWSTATINGLKRDFIPKSKIKEFVKENKWDLLETEYHFESTVVDVDELLKFMEDK